MASHQAFNGIYLNRDTDQIILGSDITKTTTLHSAVPTASRNYTISDMGQDASFLMSTSQNGQTLSGNVYLLGTITGASITNSIVTSTSGLSINGTLTGSLSGTVVNLNTISGGTLSDVSLVSPTFLSNVTNSGIISGGSVSGTTFIGNNTLYGTVTSGTFSNAYLLGQNYLAGTLTDGSLSGNIQNLNTISGGTLSNNILMNSSVSGNIYNLGTISGGTLSNVIMSGGSILANVNILGGTGGSGSTVQDSTLSNNTLTGTNVNLGTLDFGTMTNMIMTSGTITSGVTVLATSAVTGNLSNSTISSSTLSGTIYNLGTLSGGTLTNVHITSLTGGSIVTEFTNLESILTNTSYYYVVPTSYSIPTTSYGTYRIYSTIQSAVDACNTAGGGTVMLMTGTYTLTSTVTLYANTTLQGQGTGATIINCASVSSGTSVFTASATNHIMIRDLQVYSNNTSNAMNPFVFTNSCNYVTLQNVYCNFVALTGTTAQPAISFGGDASNTAYVLCNIIQCVINAVNLSYSGKFQNCYVRNSVLWEASSLTSVGYKITLVTPALTASDNSEIFFISNLFYSSASGQQLVSLTNTVSSPSNLYSGILISFQQNTFTSMQPTYLMTWITNRATNLQQNSQFQFIQNTFNFQYLFYDSVGNGSSGWSQTGRYQIQNNIYTGSGNPGLFSGLPSQGGSATTIYLNVYNNSPAFSLNTAYNSTSGAMTVNAGYANSTGLLVKAPTNQIQVIPMTTSSPNVNDTNLNTVNLHFNPPTANRIYTISDMGVNASFIMSDSTVAQTLSGPYALTGTISSGSLSGTIINLNTISGGTYTNNTIINPTILGNITNLGTISGGSLSSVTFLGDTTVAGTLTGGTYSNSTLTGNVYNLGTITSGSLTSFTGYTSTLSNMVLQDTNTNIGLLDGGTLTGALQNPVSNSGISFINGGNVGIGTSSPSSTLHVAGTFQATSATLTTAVVTGDPVGSQTGYTGNYAMYQLSTGSYAVGESVIVWDTPNVYFQSGISHNNGVFTFTNTGVYVVSIELLPTFNFASSNHEIRFQSSNDGINFTTVNSSKFYGATFSGTYRTDSSLRMQYLINVTASSLYWQAKISNTNALDNITFTTDQTSRIQIYSVPNSYHYATYTSTSMGTTSNTILTFNSTPVFTTSDISNNGTIFTFTNSGLYIFYMQISISTGNSTSRTITCFIECSNDGTTFFTYQSYQRNSAYNNGEMFTFFFTADTSAFKYWRLKHSNVTSALGLSGLQENNFLIIYKINDIGFGLARNAVVTYATSPLPLYTDSKRTDSLIYDATTGEILFKYDGIYFLMLDLNSESAAITPVSFALQYSSDNGASFSANQYTSTDYKAGWTGSDNIRPMFYMFQVTSSSRLWKIVYTRTIQINWNAAFEWGRIMIGSATVPTITPTGGLYKSYYNSGEIIRVLNFTNLSYYFIGGHLSLANGRTLPTTGGFSTASATNYRLGMKFFEVPFTVTQTAGNSILICDIDGSYSLGSSTVASNVTATLEYKNSVMTDYKGHIQIFQAATGGGTRSGTCFPLRAMFLNSGSPSLTNTLTLYMHSSGTSYVFLSDEFYLKTFSLQITEVRV